MSKEGPIRLWAAPVGPHEQFSKSPAALYIPKQNAFLILEISHGSSAVCSVSAKGSSLYAVMQATGQDHAWWVDCVSGLHPRPWPSIFAVLLL